MSLALAAAQCTRESSHVEWSRYPDHSAGPPGRSSPLAAWRRPKNVVFLLPALLSPPTPKVVQDHSPRHPLNSTTIPIFVETMPQAIAEC
jgi:hypothetical protein